MDPRKFNIDDILKDSHKNIRKNPYVMEEPGRREEVREDRPWNNLSPHKNRVFAFLIDVAAINLLVVVCYYLFTDFGGILNDSLAGSDDHYTKRAFWEQIRFIQWTTIGVWIIYGAIMEGSERRATFGKEYMGIQVVDKEGKQLTTGLAIKRNISKILSHLIYGLGFLWSFWDSDRQTWHDKLAKTYVIQAEEKQQGGLFL